MKWGIAIAFGILLLVVSVWTFSGFFYSYCTVYSGRFSGLAELSAGTANIRVTKSRISNEIFPTFPHRDVVRYNQADPPPPDRNPFEAPEPDEWEPYQPPFREILVGSSTKVSVQRSFENPVFSLRIPIWPMAVIASGAVFVLLMIKKTRNHQTNAKDVLG